MLSVAVILPLKDGPSQHVPADSFLLAVIGKQRSSAAKVLPESNADFIVKNLNRLNPTNLDIINNTSSKIPLEWKL